MPSPRLITLKVEPQGNGWAVTTDPDSADVYSDETIVWDVIAPPGVSVDVTEFRCTSSAPSLIFASGPTRSGNRIKAHLKKGCFAPVYKYKVLITDANDTWYVDPDIQIKER